MVDETLVFLRLDAIPGLHLRWNRGLVTVPMSIARMNVLQNPQEVKSVK